MQDAEERAPKPIRGAQSPTVDDVGDSLRLSTGRASGAPSALCRLDAPGPEWSLLVSLAAYRGRSCSMVGTAIARLALPVHLVCARFRAVRCVCNCRSRRGACALEVFCAGE